MQSRTNLQQLSARANRVSVISHSQGPGTVAQCESIPRQCPDPPSGRAIRLDRPIHADQSRDRARRGLTAVEAPNSRAREQSGDGDPDAISIRWSGSICRHRNHQFAPEWNLPRPLQKSYERSAGDHRTECQSEVAVIGTEPLRSQWIFLIRRILTMLEPTSVKRHPRHEDRVAVSGEDVQEEETVEEGAAVADDEETSLKGATPVSACPVGIWKLSAPSGQTMSVPLVTGVPQQYVAIPLITRTAWKKIPEMTQIKEFTANTANSRLQTAGRAPVLHLSPAEELLRQLLLACRDSIVSSKNDVTNLDMWFVGGWVRDRLLDRQSSDIDVALSSMTGIQFGHALEDYLSREKSKYIEEAKRLGAPPVISKLHEIKKNSKKSKHLETGSFHSIFGLSVDFVNLRKETYSGESRIPRMEFGTPEEDAHRRDATINALFYSLNTGIVEDHTGLGLHDLAAGVIRTPSSPFDAFDDDPLRIL
ncbi:uncharacterized protein CDV56_101244 [Aspergillus thermomutatus]|uniref:Poly A polymerase head domain-containing protein n=1 Tax=Aspergillus thermomutatus TaxID=41047 RepID=A0A397GC57_ASPTH|nr:uncharacterized protein CDV56_101244 [Aspergillus thermomutatus]RHZ47218.1 hypothetical protein CDV56_101244 [Aspergillus thermomutatus]